MSDKLKEQGVPFKEAGSRVELDLNESEALKVISVILKESKIKEDRSFMLNTICDIVFNNTLPVDIGDKLHSSGVRDILDILQDTLGQCSECGNIMNEGYVIESSEDLYCSDKCLEKNMTREEFLKLHDKDNGDAYWTDWKL